MEKFGNGLAKKHQIIVLFVHGLEVQHLAVCHLQELADFRNLRQININIDNLDSRLSGSQKNDVLPKKMW